MINTTNNISDNTCNGKCSKCGQCCSAFIPLTNRELKEIKKYVKNNKIKLKNRDLKDGSYDGTCAFWNMETKLCEIYPVRPFVCRSFICNNKDWLNKRDQYDKRATINSTLNKNLYMATFDDLIYGDCTLLIRWIVNMIKDENGQVSDDKFIKILKYIGRQDVLDCTKIILKDDDKN